MKNKVMIVITTYNRKDLIDLTSVSLAEIEGIDYNNVFIFDDCSTEYSISYLRKKYPGAHIMKSKNNLGADKNIERAYKYFMKSSYDYFFNADSDLLFRKDLLSRIDSIIDKFNRDEPILFSVFNTKNHDIMGEYDDELIIKKDVGAGGCVFNKKAIKLFINELPDSYDEISLAVDYAFCKIYSSLGYKILVTKNSLVQHIGIEGQNSNNFLFDWGVGFNIDSITNAKAIVSLYEDNINLNVCGIEERVIDYAKKRKFGISLALKILFITIKNKIRK